MGTILSAYVKRPVKNWNIENRSHRYIQKEEKPLPAPRHPSTAAAFEQLVAEHPEIREDVMKKDEQLAGFLKGMVVNPEKLGEITSSVRKLPETRAQPPSLEYGFVEPPVIRPGRFSMRHALDFLAKHVTDPSGTGSAEYIARQYSLDIARVRSVLLHFSVFSTEKPKALTEATKSNNETQTQFTHTVDGTEKQS